jgi:hypothetical protein
MSTSETDVIENTTCFAEHEKRGLACEKRSCRLWLDCPSHLNCTMLAAANGPMTLQDIGDIFGVTRMRICQIEKSVKRKFRERIEQITLPSRPSSSSSEEETS